MRSSILRGPDQKRVLNSGGAPNEKYFNSNDTTSLLAAHSWFMTEVRAQVIVVPNANTTNDGDSFITGDSGGGAVRYMLILDASQFRGLSGPCFLTQLAVRPDTIPGPSGPQTGTYRIYASTTSRSVSGMSATFADNLGTNNTLVFDGTMMLSTENLPGPGNTRQFDYVYSPFTTPFLYDPAAGNLLLDFQYSSFNGSLLQWDAVTGNPTSSAIAASGSPTVPTGFFGQSPLYQFTFAAPTVATIRASQVGGSVLEQPIERHVSSAVSFGPDHQSLDFAGGLRSRHRGRHLCL